MNIKSQAPIFAPRAMWPELEKMSKAALMDIVWDRAQMAVPAPASDDQIMAELQEHAATILLHRAAAKERNAT